MKRFTTFLIVLLAALFFVGAVDAKTVNMRGLSTDTKPSAGIDPGSTFYETDTTYTSVYKSYPDGTRAWVRSTVGTADTFYLATLSAAGSTAITATADELNILDGCTATYTELNRLAGVTAGTTAASKALVVDADSRLDVLTLGSLKLGIGAGTAVTSTAAELNTVADTPTAITTSATPATGTCAVQFVFNNAAGSSIGHIHSGIAYISSNVGAHSAGVSTSIAALTNGSMTELVAGKVIEYTTKVDGTFGVTLTGAGGSFYLTFVLPNGKIVTSTVCTIN